MSKYIKLYETSVKTQAVLGAANTGRKDLLPLIEALTGSEDKMLDRAVKWAVNQLK